MNLLRRSAPTTEAASSATLDMLPRLPDTAEEVRGIAVALHADVAKDVFLGAAASEKSIAAAGIGDRRIIVFATHGLVPGDLDGLTQPALALSNPKVSGGGGDGLLTVDKILALKLDADWVVLSACNTAAGEGSGERLSVAVRPEKVQIVVNGANGAALDNRFAGTVESVNFLGGSILYRIAIADRLVLAVEPNDGSKPLHAPGEAVTLGWAAQDAVLLRE